MTEMDYVVSKVDNNPSLGVLFVRYSKQYRIWLQLEMSGICNNYKNAHYSCLDI